MDWCPQDFLFIILSFWKTNVSKPKSMNALLFFVSWHMILFTNKVPKKEPFTLFDTVLYLWYFLYCMIAFTVHSLVQVLFKCKGGILTTPSCVATLLSLEITTPFTVYSNSIVPNTMGVTIHSANGKRKLNSVVAGPSNDWRLLT